MLISAAAIAAVVAAATLTATILVALVWPDLVLTTADGGPLLSIAAGCFTAILLIASLDSTLVQTASARWPSYIYSPDPRAERMVLSLVVFGLSLVMCGFGASMAGAPNWLLSGVAGVSAIVGIILLANYVIDQMAVFDPLGYTRRAALQMLRSRPDGRRAGLLAEGRYLRHADRLLGLARWLAQNKRPHDACMAIELAVDEIRSECRTRRTRGGRHSTWYVAGGDLSFATVPSVETALFPSITCSETARDASWIELACADWLSRSMAFVAVEGVATDDRAGWDAWLSLAREWLDWSLEQRDEAVVSRMIRNIARPLLTDRVGPRQLRDRLVEMAVQGYADAVGGAGFPGIEERLWDQELRLLLHASRGSEFRAGVSFGDHVCAAVAMTRAIASASTTQDSVVLASQVCRFEMLVALAEADLAAKGDRDEFWHDLHLLNTKTVLGPAKRVRSSESAVSNFSASLASIAAARPALAGRAGLAHEYDAAAYRLARIMADLPWWRFERAAFAVDRVAAVRLVEDLERRT